MYVSLKTHQFQFYIYIIILPVDAHNYTNFKSKYENDPNVTDSTFALLVVNRVSKNLGDLDVKYTLRFPAEQHWVCLGFSNIAFAACKITFGVISFTILRFINKVSLCDCLISEGSLSLLVQSVPHALSFQSANFSLQILKIFNFFFLFH